MQVRSRGWRIGIDIGGIVPDLPPAGREDPLHLDNWVELSRPGRLMGGGVQSGDEE